MNNDLNDTQLENLFRGLPPAAASHSLVQRVDEELQLDMSWLSTTSRSKPQRQTRWLTSASWAAMGAAAAIAVMSYLPQQASPQALAAATTLPVVQPGSTIREWDDTQERGIHRGRSQMDEARALVVSRELGTWVDPRYGSQLTMDIPSQRQLLMPVSYK